MVQVPMFGELVAVAETPASRTEVLAVGSIEIDVKKFLELSHILFAD